MNVVQSLMENASADVDLLRSLDAQGDDFGVPREVDFMLRAPSQQKAELVRDFVNDHRYGAAKATEADGQHGVEIRIQMPIQQNVIGAVSGFMACLAALYGLDYDGWGCVAQVKAQSRDPRG